MTYFDDKQSLYEVLGLSPNASEQEVLDAYQRILAEIETDYLALYSMVDDAELAGRRRRVQMAFETLSDPGRRANYDGDNSSYPALTVSSQASLTPDHRVGIVTSVEQANTTVSHTGEDIRDSDFSQPRSRFPQSSRYAPSTPSSPVERKSTSEVEPRARAAQRALDQSMQEPKPAAPSPVVLTPDILAELTADKDITGSLLKTLRETAGLTLDQMAANTKISKRYLRAIEADDYATLPAKVYTRGFVRLYASVLGLDADRVAASFMELVERGSGGA